MLEIQKSPVEGGTRLRLTGRVDETLNVDALLAGLGGVVIVDLRGVRQFNSYGVRAWIDFVEGFGGTYLGFTHCRPATTTQFNSVARFGGRGELISLYAPYLCPRCGQCDELLIDLRRQYREIRQLRPPALKCSRCVADSEFDDLPEAFFLYAAHRPPPAPPPLAATLIDGPGESHAPFRINKDVRVNLTALWLSGHPAHSGQLRRAVDGVDGEVLVIPAGVQLLDTGAVHRLRPALELADASVYLARVPLPLAASLAAAPGGFGRSRVVSLQLPAECPACQQTALRELPASALRHDALKATCRGCGLALPVKRPAELGPLLPLLPLEDAPGVLADYLARHPEPPPLTLELGSPDAVSSERYELEARLGCGGMGEVFLARQRGAGGFEKRVVLKRVLPHLAADPDVVAMLLYEARLAARINHPNVVQIFDVERHQNAYVILMEYVEGMDLARALGVQKKQQTLIPVPVALRIFADVCAGLSAAHGVAGPDGTKAPIIHRDVSPGNVLLSSCGVAKVSDFGIAKAVGAGAATPTRQLKGKLSFMAPEQLSGAEATVKSDLFATGIILYTCLTSRHPFHRNSEIATVGAIVKGEYPPVSSLRADLPERLEAVIGRALACKPEERYDTAAQMQGDLEAVLHSLGEPCTPLHVATWLREVLAVAPSVPEVFPASAPAAGLPRFNPALQDHIVTGSLQPWPKSN